MHVADEGNDKGKHGTKEHLIINCIMDNNLFIVLVFACTITHFIRTVYEILKHKKILKPGRLSFIIIFINMGILWMSWFVLCGLDTNRIEVPEIIKLMGLIIICGGAVVFFTALFTIKTLESYDGNLITKGIYSKIRHPMYTGFIMWLTGFPLFYGAGFSFLLSLAFIANVLFWRYLEEKELEKRFPDYLNYKKTTLF